MTEKFGEDYFLRGQELGISGYTDYRWMPELTMPMVVAMVQHLGVGHDDTVLDFGCARGYVVRAFREIGYNAWGYDVSQWALENADSVVKGYLKGYLPHKDIQFDWVIAKDVLEHVEDVASTAERLMGISRKGIFVVVPLAEYNGGHYIIRDYERDVTHVQRMTLSTWAGMFMTAGWSVEARYQVRGIKDNYSQYLTGNGFITARRIGG